MVSSGLVIGCLALVACGGGGAAPRGKQPSPSPLVTAAPTPEPTPQPTPAPTPPPDGDQDGDKIADSVDKCPAEAECYNGYEDEDGCPDRGKVLIEAQDIRILDKVFFARNSAKLEKMSEALLDAIAKTLEGHPEIELVAVHGHADKGERGAAKLAEQRAQVVYDALVKLGVATARLSHDGLGQTLPVAKAPDEKNRRVEFEIARMAAPEPVPPPQGCAD